MEKILNKFFFMEKILSRFFFNVKVLLSRLVRGDIGLLFLNLGSLGWILDIAKLKMMLPIAVIYISLLVLKYEN